MEKFITKVEEMRLKVVNDKINQTQRNAIKSDFMNSLVELFASKGLTLHRVKEGLILKVENDEHDLHFEIDAVVKSLDYDLVANVDEFIALQSEKQTRAIELNAKKEKLLKEKKVKSK
jgi:hypothetical protein